MPIGQMRRFRKQKHLSIGVIRSDDRGLVVGLRIESPVQGPDRCHDVVRLDYLVLSDPVPQQETN